MDPTDIPASGAWRPDMPVANRKFLNLLGDGRIFALEGGGHLDEVTIAYETWGDLDDSASNAVLICHALTGDAHAAGPSCAGQPTDGWWNDLIGPGKAIDTDRVFVVCANVLGGCQGSTGPASPHPHDGKPYGPRFPVVSVRDMVRTQAALADHLGIDKWLSVVGGSMGGMQVLEWAVMFPHRLQSMINIASAASASPLQIGWSQIGRLAIALDPNWNGGDYYDLPDGQGPHLGLMLARRVAQIHYRSDQSLEMRFGRSTVDRIDTFALWDRFQVEGYLDHHGQKLAAGSTPTAISCSTRQWISTTWAEGAGEWRPRWHASPVRRWCSRSTVISSTLPVSSMNWWHRCGLPISRSPTRSSTRTTATTDSSSNSTNSNRSSGSSSTTS